MVQLKKALYLTGLGLALGCSYSQEDNNRQKLDKSDSEKVFYIKNKKDLENANRWIDSIMYSESAGKNLEEKINPANPLDLDSSYRYSEKDLEKFNNWVDQTINESKQKNSNAIIINKSDYALYVVKQGKVKYKYPVELGSNPYDDKKIEGDGCTPEGTYKINKKLDKGQTSFYKAFLLDYPNQEDKKKRKTGGMIEIHGSGSGSSVNYGGSNWTFGCIALSDEDIDEIFDYINKDDKIIVIKYTSINLDKKLYEY